ncbi:MAG: glucose-6-phosphate isomerase [Coriobacteriia bacterium]
MGALQRLVDLDAISRVRLHDASLFSTDAEVKRAIEGSLGWTTLAEEAADLLPELSALEQQLAEEGCTDVVLLGMGGSSLAALVLGHVLGGSAKRRLTVLDTTAPLTIDRALAELDPAKTLFIVASKSGGTIEPMSLYAIFRDAAENELGAEEAGLRFVALTDTGTSLEQLAREEGFRTVITTPTTVGGRFSALSAFGLAPAALAGVDVSGVVTRADAMEAACSLPLADNPAVTLAAAIADAYDEGRDKLTLATSEVLAPFGLWVEQLVAESLGKDGRGIVPVIETSGYAPAVYGADRFVVGMRLESDAPLRNERHALAEELAAEFVLRDPLEIGAQFVLWEHAVALLGALLGVNPFDQPNVAAAKAATAAALAGELEVPAPSATTAGGTALTFAGALKPPAHRGQVDEMVETAVAHALVELRPGDYVAILAYLPEDEELLAPLRQAVPGISDASTAAITLEIGPRYLHSTGQLHKGGPDTGLFIIVTTRDCADTVIPGKPWTLRTLHRAQVEGDLVTLAAAGRRVLRIDMPDCSADSVKALAHALMDAAGAIYQGQGLGSYAGSAL